MLVVMLGMNTTRVLALDPGNVGFGSLQYQAPIVEEIEMLPDPLLNNSQIVNVEGASDNFGWTYTLAAENGEYNHLSLIWNHTAGDPINFRNPAELDSDLPESYDFIYMKQTFEWPHNEMPEGARISNSLLFSYQNDFDYYDDYIRHYIWLIDSTGDWIEIRDSSGWYPDDFREYYIDVQSDEIERAWGGMIQDEYGVQTDPNDTLTLAVGFAPALDFENYTDSLSGSVTMTIRNVSLLTLHDQIQDTIVEPDIVGYADITSISGLYGVESSPDGSLYTVQSVGSFEIWNYDIVVQKWSSQCVPLWSRSLSGPDIHLARDFEVLNDGSVLVLGREIKAAEDSPTVSMLIRWNGDGDITWKHLLEEFQGYRLSCMTVALDGSVYVGGNYENMTDERSWAFLAKLTPAGTSVWSKTWMDAPGDQYSEVYRIITSEDGTVYAQSRVVSRFDSNGNRVQIYDPTTSWLWISFSDADSEGNLYGTHIDSYSGTGLSIVKMDRNGTFLWNSSWGRVWHSSMSSFYEGIDLEVGEDGSIYVGGATGRYSRYYYYIVKWDKDGNVLTSVAWIYDAEEQISPGFSTNRDMLAISSNGYVYTVLYVYTEQSAKIQLSGFQIGSVGLAVVLDPTVRVITTVAVSSLGIAALIFLAKRRGLINT
jgi:hypothetical protein